MTEDTDIYLLPDQVELHCYTVSTLSDLRTGKDAERKTSAAFIVVVYLDTHGKPTTLPTLIGLN